MVIDPDIEVRQPNTANSTATIKLIEAQRNNNRRFLIILARSPKCSGSIMDNSVYIGDNPGNLKEARYEP